MQAAGEALPNREFGVLLHITSLPGPGPRGDLGPDSHRFIDFLCDSGAGVWQVLPLVPTHPCGSPYNGQSIHAGNHLLISVEKLHEDGFVSSEELRAFTDHAGDEPVRAEAHCRVLRLAFNHAQGPGSVFKQEMDKFERENQSWLQDYALYRVLKAANCEQCWHRWPVPLRERDAGAIARARQKYRQEIEFVTFQQYLFWRQWRQLKRRANVRGIRIMGDVPIFPAHDSAEVWSHPEFFQLNLDGSAINVAGVPPDYFSPNGQHWGNPLYNWLRMRADGFGWWLDRIQLQLRHFDLLRLDHFRGFESYWSIPARSEDATGGHWQPAPGGEFFEALLANGRRLPLVAEDLGQITPAVDELRRRFHLPGMRVLQFAFDGDANNPHLPHNHEHLAVIFTGTHDNPTTAGWFHSLDAGHQQRVYGYLGLPQEPMPWALIRSAMSSVSRLAVLPMQDVLGLGDSARMNMPGTETGNWSWRFDWPDVPADAAGRLRHLAAVYGRITPQKPA